MFKKRRTKEPHIVVLVYRKETFAEIVKNYLKEEYFLTKIFKLYRVKLNPHDFMFMNYINDNNKLFKVVFQYTMKGTDREILKLRKVLSIVFECKSHEIENKKDFNFEKLNLDNPLNKEDIYISSTFSSFPQYDFSYQYEENTNQNFVNFNENNKTSINNEKEVENNNKNIENKNDTQKLDSFKLDQNNEEKKEKNLDPFGNSSSYFDIEEDDTFLTDNKKEIIVTNKNDDDYNSTNNEHDVKSKLENETLES